MTEQQIRLLPVGDRNRRLMGIISLSGPVIDYDPVQAGQALSGIALPTNKTMP